MLLILTLLVAAAPRASLADNAPGKQASDDKDQATYKKSRRDLRAPDRSDKSHSDPGQSSSNYRTNKITVPHGLAPHPVQTQRLKPVALSRPATPLSSAFVQSRRANPLTIRPLTPRSTNTTTASIDGTGMKRKPWLP